MMNARHPRFHDDAFGDDPASNRIFPGRPSVTIGRFIGVRPKIGSR
jgi:hypothetical protein